MKTLTRTRKTKPDLKGLIEVQEAYGISFTIVEKAVEGGGSIFYVTVSDPVGSNMRVPNTDYGEYFGSTNRDFTQSSMLRWLKSGESELRSRLFHMRIPKFHTIEELHMKLAIQGG